MIYKEHFEMVPQKDLIKIKWDLGKWGDINP